MTVYYNENHKFSAAWLRELIKAGEIADGEVDERSIEDVAPNDLVGFSQCHFFAGIGVWSYALRRAGIPDDYPIWTGSCPCQPFSSAGKRKGFADERHLWPAWYWLIAECGPPEIIGEQVADKSVGPWVDLVQADLEALDYTFGAVPFPACGVGADNKRKRTYWLANASGARLQRFSESLNINDPSRWEAAPGRTPSRLMAASLRADAAREEQGADGRIRRMPSSIVKGVDVPASIVEQLRGYGNAINAAAAEAFIRAALA